MAIKAKVPVIPGSDGTVDNEKDALIVAKQIGFPVIIKAVAGGGGKGMRTAHNAVAFAKEYNNARNEAEKAFGNGAVYLERFLDAPRHIEIQLLGDQFGNVIHLGERDCSIQRRHQKVIEEAPSPFISDDIRKKMGRDAVKLAKSVNYEGAGTVEFLVDGKGEYFFIEMNTRIQVEHGVTEEVTGVDLVKEQLLIASGQKLSYEQKDIKITKHCIECRVCAEDPSTQLRSLPRRNRPVLRPGWSRRAHRLALLQRLHHPPYYDSMIAKVMTFGRNPRTCARPHGPRTRRISDPRDQNEHSVLAGNHPRSHLPRRQSHDEVHRRIHRASAQGPLHLIVITVHCTNHEQRI